MLTFALLAGSAAAIYVACDFFVNGIEWLGRRLGLGETATGTILAAFGTALPESAVTFIAVVLGKTATSKDLGVGAALGGPLVLATLSYAMIGFAVFARRAVAGTRLLIGGDAPRLRRDQGWFFALFLIKLALGLVVWRFKSWFGILFLLAYILYLARELRGAKVMSQEELAPLKLRPRGDPGFWWPLLQSVLALIGVAVASRVFVTQLATVGLAAGWSAQLVALFLSPLATELPEIVNALIWVRQGKERLALANISGAMMIQVTVPTALGLFCTPWLFAPALTVSGLITLIAVGMLIHRFGKPEIDARQLMPLAGLYAVFVLLAGLL